MWRVRNLLEALTYSEDPLLILGLAELDSELENYQEAIQGYAQLDNRTIYEQTGIFHLSTNWFCLCTVREI